MKVRAREVVCPRAGCRLPHVAGAEGNDPLWFTCGSMRYEIPDAWHKLGTQAWVQVNAMRRRHTTGCMRCGKSVDCTDPAGGTVWWICYGCGTVGTYHESVRENYDPADDVPDDDTLQALADGDTAAANVGTKLRDPLFTDRNDDTDPQLRVVTQPEAEGPTLEQMVERALATAREFDPPKQLRIDAGEMLLRDIDSYTITRRGSTSVDGLAITDPDSIEGSGIGPRCRRAVARFERWMVGAG